MSLVVVRNLLLLFFIIHNYAVYVLYLSLTLSYKRLKETTINQNSKTDLKRFTSPIYIKSNYDILQVNSFDAFITMIIIFAVFKKGPGGFCSGSVSPGIHFVHPVICHPRPSFVKIQQRHKVWLFVGSSFCCHQEYLKNTLKCKQAKQAVHYLPNKTPRTYCLMTEAQRYRILIQRHLHLIRQLC